MNRTEQEALLEAQAYVNCNGEWKADSDGMTRCTECHSIHPLNLLDIASAESVKVRRVEYGRERIEFWTVAEAEKKVVFDTVHIPSWGVGNIKAVLNHLHKFTFMEWKFNARTLSTTCWFETKKRERKTAKQLQDDKYVQQVFMQMQAKGILTGSILYPDQIECLARRGES